MTNTVNDIPPDEFAQMQQRLIEQIARMDQAEFEIIAKTEASLGFFIAKTLESIATLLGYVIAIPLAWGIRFAREVSKGFSRGFKQGMESAGIDEF